MTKVRRIVLMIAVIVFLIFSTLYFIGHHGGESYQDKNDYVMPTDAIASNFSDYHDIIKKDVALFSIVDNKDQEIGMIVFTSPISDDIIGFYRSIPMTILMDKDQKIVDVIFNKNDETPSYMQKLENKEFTNTFIGLTSHEIIDKQIDAVSGATLSSNAITNSIKKRMTYLEEQLNPKPVIDANFIIAAIGLLSIVIIICTKKKQ